MPDNKQTAQPEQRPEEKLELSKETLKDLEPAARDEVKGGMVDLHTSFSCGRDICTTYP